MPQQENDRNFHTTSTVDNFLHQVGLCVIQADNKDSLNSIVRTSKEHEKNNEMFRNKHAKKSHNKCVIMNIFDAFYVIKYKTIDEW